MVLVRDFKIQFLEGATGKLNSAPRVYACGSDEGYIMFDRDGDLL